MYMDLKKIAITDLLPQRPPMLMVDRVVASDAKSCSTELTIRGDNLFVDDGALSAAGLIENMAQSCAVRIGIVNMMLHPTGGGVLPGKRTIGVIGDISDFVVERQPRIGETLTTEVLIVGEVLALSLAQLTTRVADETVATARMKIALTEVEE